MPRKFFINIWKKITFFIPAEILNLKFTPAKKMLRLGYFSKIGLARISTTFPANGQILLHRKYCVKIPDQKAINSIIEEVKKSVHKLESEIEAVKQIYSANPSLANSWLTNLQQNFSALRNGMDEQFKCLVEQLENGMDQKHRGTIEELREQMQANYDDLFEELEKRMHQKHGHLLIEEAEKRMDQKYKGLIEQLEKRMDEKQKLKGSGANEKSIEEVNEKIQFVYENLLDEIAKQMDSNNRSLIEALLKAQNGEIKEMDKKLKGSIEQLEKRMDEKYESLIEQMKKGMEEKQKTLIEPMNKEMIEKPKGIIEKMTNGLDNLNARLEKKIIDQEEKELTKLLEKYQKRKGAFEQRLLEWKKNYAKSGKAQLNQ